MLTVAFCFRSILAVHFEFRLGSDVFRTWRKYLYKVPYYLFGKRCWFSIGLQIASATNRDRVQLNRDGGLTFKFAKNLATGTRLPFPYTLLYSITVFGKG